MPPTPPPLIGGHVSSLREIAVAKTAKKAAVSAASSEPQVERPKQPQRFKADKAQLLQFYREMLLIRRFEERAGQLYGLGLIGGFCHLYIGQEAVVTGIKALRYSISTSRMPTIAPINVSSAPMLDGEKLVDPSQ